MLGVCTLYDYSTRPGQHANAPHIWPQETNVPARPGRSQVLVFIHPHCPCTRATLYQLERLQAAVGGRIATTLVICIPHGVAGDWHQTDLYRSAAAMADTTVHLDRGSTQAAAFGVKTSGHVLVYDPTGSLIYSGGITSGRGHAGANPGVLACRESILHPQFLRCHAVYGCPLHAEER